jgi:acyl-CoA dehydrogenase
LPNYLFGTAEFDPVPMRRYAGDDAFLFDQGPTRGLGKIAFGDWRSAFDAFDSSPNVAVFREQAEALVAMVSEAPLTPEQMSDDLDFQQSLAQIFTLVPYGQLILEEAGAQETSEDVVDSMFEWLVRDFSRLALDLHGKASSTPEQQQWVLDSIRKPVIDPEREDRIYAEVRALAGAYQPIPT